MIQPQELEVWYVLPSLRKEIVLGLLERGKSQKMIAELMQVTPAAISQYKSNKRATTMSFDGKARKEVGCAVKRLAEGNSCITKELQLLCGVVKKEGLLCGLHKKHSNICRACKVCLE